MVFNREDIVQLTKEIWTSMLSLPIDPIADFKRCPEESPSRISACVQISGAWEGAVRLDCSSELAKLAASKFVGMEPAGVSVEDMRDAMGELANMSAGSVKTLLPRPSHLSLPSVADGRDFELSVRRGEIILQSLFECEGEPLRLSIFQRQGANSES